MIRIILIACTLLLAGCGIELPPDPVQTNEIDSYGSFIPDWLAATYPKPRYVRIDPTLPAEVKRAVPKSLTLLNTALCDRHQVCDRYRLYNEQEPPPPDSIIIDVVDYTGQGLCESPGDGLAELARSPDGFTVRLCYTKIARARLRPPPPGERPALTDFVCLIAHELLHSDLRAHLSNNTGCQLMCERPTVCQVSDQALAIWGRYVLPKIER